MLETIVHVTSSKYSCVKEALTAAAETDHVDSYVLPTNTVRTLGIDIAVVELSINRKLCTRRSRLQTNLGHCQVLTIDTPVAKYRSTLRSSSGSKKKFSGWFTVSAPKRQAHHRRFDCRALFDRRD